MNSATVGIPIGADHCVISDGYRLHVWEKCMAHEQLVNHGAERTVLLIHGGTYSGPTDYDIQVPGKNYSLMDYLARRGHDVFTFAVRGYGRSERPENPLTISTDAAVRDTAAVIQYICELRGAQSINLLGWSWGGAHRPDIHCPAS